MTEELFDPEKLKELDIIFKQYKLCVEMANHISARRATANGFYLTANTIIVTGISIFIESDTLYLIILPLIIGVLFCISWHYLIDQYKKLNGAKFQVINKIEEMLPVKAFGVEWQLLKSGKERKIYWPLTHIEGKIPLFLSSFYSISICVYIVAFFLSGNYLGLIP